MKTSAVPPQLPTLCQYKHFHGMLCSPRTAQAACRSFASDTESCILFLPDAEVRTFEFSHPDAADMSDYDSSGRLDVVTYYLLVLLSLTGLSTLLGMTECIDAREFDDAIVVGGSNDHQAPPYGDDDERWLRSERDPDRVFVPPEVLRYLARRSSDSAPPRLKRRFEYDFRLVGLHVLMLHFVTTTAQRSGGENDDEGMEVLHLVEVYRFRHPIVRACAGAAFSMWSTAMKWMTMKGRRRSKIA